MKLENYICRCGKKFIDLDFLIDHIKKNHKDMYYKQYLKEMGYNELPKSKKHKL